MQPCTYRNHRNLKLLNIIAAGTRFARFVDVHGKFYLLVINPYMGGNVTTAVRRARALVAPSV